MLLLLVFASLVIGSRHIGRTPGHHRHQRKDYYPEHKGRSRIELDFDKRYASFSVTEDHFSFSFYTNHLNRRDMEDPSHKRKHRRHDCKPRKSEPGSTPLEVHDSRQLTTISKTHDQDKGRHRKHRHHKSRRESRAKPEIVRGWNDKEISTNRVWYGRRDEKGPLHYEKRSRQPHGDIIESYQPSRVPATCSRPMQDGLSLD